MLREGDEENDLATTGEKTNTAAYIYEGSMCNHNTPTAKDKKMQDSDQLIRRSGN